MFILEKRPISSESLKKFEQTSKKKITLTVTNSSPKTFEKSSSSLNGNLPGKLTLGDNLVERKKSPDNQEVPKSPGRLIKSPRSGESKFVSAGIINSKSPHRNNKVANMENKDDVLDKSSKKITNVTISEPLENFVKNSMDPKGKFPVRKGLLKIANLKDIMAAIVLPKDESNNNNYEGYLYKFTKTKKLKKMYFRLIHKDMYCTFVLFNS